MFGLKRCTLLIVGLLALKPSLSSLAGEARQDDLWKLTAQSHFILEGVLDVPVSEIRLAARSGKHRYIELGLAVEQALKGKLKDKSLAIRFYTRPSPHGPSPKAVTDLTGKRAVVFLIRSDEAGAQGYYFAGYTPAALRASAPKAVDRVKQEVEKQRQILRDFEKHFRPEQKAAYAKVKQLIEATMDPASEPGALRDLEALGHDAVAPIIMLMDDRRPLPVKRISLSNPSRHWEAVRHYRPQVVADALDAILNQITGESFGSIANGASDRERQETVNGWRIYLHHSKNKTEKAGSGRR